VAWGDETDTLERPDSRDGRAPRRKPPVVPIVIGFVVLVGAYFLWRYLSTPGGKAVNRAPEVMTMDLTPPPPPPPPPPQEPPPPDTTPQDKPVEATNPAPQPTPADAPKAVSIDAPAQAGTDSFGVQAGSGGGLGSPGSLGNALGAAKGLGGGNAEAFYGAALAQELQRAVTRDDRVNRRSFRAELNVWVENRRVTRAEITRSTGDREVDQNLIAALTGASISQAAPDGIRFPARVSVSGQRT